MTETEIEVGSHEWIVAKTEELKGWGETSPRLARDPVNQPQIHTWLEAIGDPNPAYRSGDVAPPAMAQVWTMYGLDPARPEGDPLHAMMGVMDEAGFTSVLGTNCDQTYERYLRPGEQVSITTRLESVVGPKRTGVGEGYFVTTRSVWRVGDEQVATMLFRVLKFKPRPKADGPSGDDLADPSRTVRPVVNRDSQFFWEGTSAGELRIQKCASCDRLRHPPGPMCPHCHSTDTSYVVSPGRGTVFSYVIHHAPVIPGKKLPLLIGLVELEDGVRMLGELRGVPHDQVRIGMPVTVGFDRIDDELTLPFWQPVEPADSAGTVDSSKGVQPESSVHNPALQAERERLPEWELPITPTLVVSTALATRDFQDVHHDRDLAVMRGSKDIFLNILTTTGLVQRYVGEWAGFDTVIKACELRLGAPAYPGDTLCFAGTVAEQRETDAGTEQVVDVVGTVSLGAHVTARVTVVRPHRTAEAQS